MAQSNYERIREAPELFNQGLRPYVERELKAVFREDSQKEARRGLSDTHRLCGRDAGVCG